MKSSADARDAATARTRVSEALAAQERHLASADLGTLTTKMQVSEVLSLLEVDQRLALGAHEAGRSGVRPAVRGEQDSESAAAAVTVHRSVPVVARDEIPEPIALVRPEPIALTSPVPVRPIALVSSSRHRRPRSRARRVLAAFLFVVVMGSALGLLAAGMERRGWHAPRAVTVRIVEWFRAIAAMRPAGLVRRTLQ